MSNDQIVSRQWASRPNDQRFLTVADLYAKVAGRRAECSVPRTVWGLVQGVTDVAHDITHTDARTDLESKAGSLLESL